MKLASIWTYLQLYLTTLLLSTAFWMTPTSISLGLLSFSTQNQQIWHGTVKLFRSKNNVDHFTQLFVTVNEISAAFGNWHFGWFSDLCTVVGWGTKCYNDTIKVKDFMANFSFVWVMDLLLVLVLFYFSLDFCCFFPFGFGFGFGLVSV